MQQRGWTGGVSGRHYRMVSAAFVILALLPAMPAHASMLRAVEVSQNQIRLSFDEAADHASAFLLEGPQRLAIDLAGVTGASASAPSSDLVTRMRYSHRAAQATRVVFDLARPAVLKGGGWADGGRSLTLALADAGDGAFHAAAREAPQSWFLRTAASTTTTRPEDALAVLPPARAYRPIGLPRVEGGRGRPLVVIDAGHGGHDPGSTSIYGGRKEKDAALGIARAVRDELLDSGRVRVAMTRSDDRFVVLDDRREIARRLHADLFISIHADSAPDSDAAHGATIYTLSEVASDRVAARLAARENRADIINGVDLGGQTPDVSSILIDLTQRESMNTAAAFAGLLQREMSPMVPFKTTFHRFASLVVLKAPDVPSVLLETGYMSNLADSQMLFSKEGQHNIALGVRRAVLAHFARQMASN